MNSTSRSNRRNDDARGGTQRESNRFTRLLAFRLALFGLVVVVNPATSIAQELPPADGAPVEAAEAALPNWAERAVGALEKVHFGFGLILLFNCGAVLTYIAIAAQGKKYKIRRIAGLEATEEAVGRATEMGRPCLFVPGIEDLNYIETVAGITVLGHVARSAARHDANVVVPTTRSMVMTAAKEAVQAAYVEAGRPESYREDNVYYVTDEQFGFVAYATGWMTREKPAACFYLGKFFAESLILAETGNMVGAMQIAGTTEQAQLPFFVAACDYTLIGEEFLAATAYLSGEPKQLGSLAGQDVGKIFAIAMILGGCLAASLMDFTPAESAIHKWLDALARVFS